MKSVAYDNTVMVLLSGGMDSAACLHFYLSRKFSVEALHVDYNQLAKKEERYAAKRLCSHYKTPLRIIEINRSNQKPVGLIPGRNSFLLQLALIEYRHQLGAIAIGTHAGTDYFDCSENFIALNQKIYDGYCNGRVRILTPFASWAKQDILEYCILHKIPLNLTYSCELGLPEACGKCKTCLDLGALHAC